MHHPAAADSPLGKTSDYVATYTPSLLFPIPRTAKWAELGLTAQTLPYQGVDLWNCYELSWLTPSGKSIQDAGIEPDIAVEMTAEDKDQNKDPQLDKALEIIKHGT